MTENDAIDWLVEHWGQAKVDRLAVFVEMLVAANVAQNLISKSTIESVWTRHIVDSAQLVHHAPDGHWVDVGSGGGLPGLVVAILRDGLTTLIEPRRLRVEFLEHVVEALALINVEVVRSKATSYNAADVAVISARAVASLGDLLLMQHSIGNCATVGLYPKGQGAKAEIVEAATRWQGVFHVKQSVTDPAAGIIIASNVRPR